MGGDTGPEITRESSPGGFPSEETPSYSELRPRPGTPMVQRTALVDRLLDCRASLVVISAHAGSGKTTVMVQWAESDPRPHAWLQLERAHNDPMALVDGLAFTLDRVTAVDPSVHRWAQLSSPPLRERILPSLRSSLAEALPFLLVLDDAHSLEEKLSWDIVEDLFNAFPAGAQLAIGTRVEPSLPLARVEASGCLFELGGRDLAFSVEETMQLLRLRGLEVDEAAVNTFQNVTEGWAAGLSLAILACGTDCDPEWLESIDGRQSNIARYLTSEVLERQRPSVRKFLLETSILSRLSEGACMAVTGRSDSGQVLARLSREDLFIVPLDDKQEWYRYHHLFAELLQAELKRRDMAKIPELHRKAAVWCEENGHLEEAVRHWLAGGDVKRAGDVVCLGHGLYSTRGHADTISHWLELFSLEQIRGHVQLSMVAGMIRAMSRRDSHPEWAAAALAASADDKMGDDDDAARVWKKLCRAFLAPEGARAMLKDAEMFIDLGESCHPAWRAPGYLYLAGARWATGDLAGAEVMYRRAIQEAHEINLSAEIAAITYLSLLLAGQGRWQEAEVESERGRRRFEESELGMDELSITVPLSEVRVIAHSGRRVSEEQMECIERDMVDFKLPAWIEVTVCLNLAQTAIDMGDVDRAERWTAQSEAILQVWPDASALEEQVCHLRRALSARRHVEAPTPAEEQVLQLLATHLTLPDIASELVVSQNTVKTHVRDLYRKLNVHSRAGAVERARELGFLKS